MRIRRGHTDFQRWITGLALLRQRLQEAWTDMSESCETLAHPRVAPEFPGSRYGRHFAGDCGS
eukprot:4756736-Prorocentrum_lima.AAC.1